MQGVSAHLEYLRNNKSKEFNYTKNIISLNRFIIENFNNVIETKTKVNGKYFKVISRYDKSKDSFTQEVYFSISGKEMSIRVQLKLKRIMRLTNDKVIFNIKLDDIVNSLKGSGNNRTAKYIKKVISEDIIRKANINDSVDIQNKIEGIVKYIGYIVIQAFIIAIKVDKLNVNI